MLPKFFLVAIAWTQAVQCVTLLSEQQLGSIWDSYKHKEGKNYHNQTEDEYRKLVFSDNLKKIVLHNLNADVGGHSHKLGINAYTDVPHDLFQRQMLGLKPNLARKSKATNTFQPDYNTSLPDSLDWRESGIVTPVKNQQSCASCWSFSAVGALEAHYSKKTGSLVKLSEQQVLDCASDDYGNQGCNGGLPDNAYRYMVDAGGVESEDCYPYEGKKGECRFSADCISAKMTGYMDITRGDEQALAIALATKGPLSVGIYAGEFEFQLYMSGVYNPDFCNQEVNHAVLLVGYGSEDGQDYWILKNSWGATWGDDGYFKLIRNAGNKCGIANLASFPEV